MGGAGCNIPSPLRPPVIPAKAGTQGRSRDRGPNTNAPFGDEKGRERWDLPMPSYPHIKRHYTEPNEIIQFAGRHEIPDMDTLDQMAAIA